ncbi:MAG: LSM domain-containing protein [Candidatus Hadarchaeales archaeon]
MPEKPFDALSRALGSLVLVGVKGGKEFRGKLAGFDVHVNIVLDEAEELLNGEVKRRYGKLIIRGDNVVYVSPGV